MHSYATGSLSPGRDSVKGAVLEPLSRIIKMKYAGAKTVPAYFQGRVAFCNTPLLFISADLRIWS